MLVITVPKNGTRWCLRVHFRNNIWSLVKKAEHLRIDAFELWYWRRFLKVPWTARRSNQSILREIKPVSLKGDQPWIFTEKTDAEAEAPVFLVNWCEQTTLWKSSWCGERSRAEGQEAIRGWDGWMASLMQGTWTLANSRRWWGTGRPGVLQSMGLQRVRQDWETEDQQQQSTMNTEILYSSVSGGSICV